MRWLIAAVVCLVIGLVLSAVLGVSGLPVLFYVAAGIFALVAVLNREDRS